MAAALRVAEPAAMTPAITPTGTMVLETMAGTSAPITVMAEVMEIRVEEIRAEEMEAEAAMEVAAGVEVGAAVEVGAVAAVSSNTSAANLNRCGLSGKTALHSSTE